MEEFPHFEGVEYCPSWLPYLNQIHPESSFQKGKIMVNEGLFSPL